MNKLLHILFFIFSWCKYPKNDQKKYLQTIIIFHGYVTVFSSFFQFAMEYNQNVIENCNSKIYPRIGFLCYHFIKFYETNSINCAQNCTLPSRIQFSDEIIFGVVKTKTNGTKMQLSIVVRDMSTHTDSYFNEDIYHEFNSIIMKLTILIS